MKTNILIPGLALALLLGACNGSESSTTYTDSAAKNDADTATALFNNKSDAEEFMHEAAVGGMMEVELGKLARKNASSKDVKDFGEMMVKDHSDANAELKTLAAQKNVSLPDSLPQDKQDKINDLSKKTGNDFDKDYMSMMVDDHKDDIDAFEKISKKDDADADVKAFASKTLPTLQKHLDAAKTIKDKQKS